MEMVRWVRMKFNRLRIWWLERFTNRIQRFTIRDPETDKEHEVVLETEVEELCKHETIKQVAPTLWKCVDSKNCDQYFQISYKVALDRNQLVEFIKDIAEHLRVEIVREGKDS